MGSEMCIRDSLGAAAVLFLGIAFAAASASTGSAVSVPPVIGTFGLVIFAFGIGNNSGIVFFQSLRTATAPVLSMIAVFIIAAIAAHTVGTYVFGLDISVIAGTFAGAITNTPSLAAAAEATGDGAAATVGYAVSYLFGVIGMMIVATLLLRDAPMTPTRLRPSLACTCRLRAKKASCLLYTSDAADDTR